MKTLFPVTRAALFGALAAAHSLTTGVSAQTTGSTPQTLTDLSASLSSGATEFPTESGSLTLNSAVLLGGPVTQPNIPLNRYLSIFVSDQDTVSQLKFSQVMNQLVAQSGQNSLTAKALFNQWFDTEAQKPGQFPLNEHCDDFSPPLPTSGIADFTALSKITLSRSAVHGSRRMRRQAIRSRTTTSRTRTPIALSPSPTASISPPRREPRLLIPTAIAANIASSSPVTPASQPPRARRTP